MLVVLLACAASPNGERPDRPPRDTSTPTDSDSAAALPLPDGVLGTLSGTSPVRLDTWPTVNYRGVDAAWSDALGVFLVVYGNAPIGGAFLDASGTQTGAGFRITDVEYDGSNWTQNPRVVADADGFLVSWHGGSGPNVQVRKVTGTGPDFAGATIDVSDPGTQQESVAALAWSPDSGEHVVVWAASGLHLRRLDASGQPLGATVDLTDAGVWVEQPAAVYSPGCGCFFVTTMQEWAGAARVILLRVEDGTGALLGEVADLTGPISFAKVTDLVHDSARDEVVATWYEIRDGVPGFAAQRFSPDGTALGPARTVFAPYGSYDGYDLAWSPVTGTSLGVFHGTSAAPAVGELAVDMQDGPTLTLDPGGAEFGVFLPHAVAHPTEPRWLVVGAPDYAAVSLQNVGWVAE